MLQSKRCDSCNRNAMSCTVVQAYIFCKHLLITSTPLHVRWAFLRNKTQNLEHTFTFTMWSYGICSHNYQWRCNSMFLLKDIVGFISYLFSTPELLDMTFIKWVCFSGLSALTRSSSCVHMNTLKIFLWCRHDWMIKIFTNFRVNYIYNHSILSYYSSNITINWYQMK